jgi:hypothetical protein
MATPIVKKRIGDYTYEVYEIKNLKGIFYNVEIYYQGKGIETNIPIYENNYTLTEVEKDVEFHIFTFGMLQNLTNSQPLVPPPSNTPIEIIPLKDKSNEEKSKTSSITKTEGKVIDDNSNQPIKGAKIIINKPTPTPLTNKSTTIPNSTGVGPYSYNITKIPINNPNSPDFFKWGAKIYYNNQFIQTIYYGSDYPEFSEVADNIVYKTYEEYEASILREINDNGYTDEITLNKYPPFKISQPTSPTTSTITTPTTSNNKGEVSLELPESPSPPTVTISAPGYETIEKTPYKGDGTVKEDLGIIQMTPIQTATEADKIEASQLKPNQINKLSDSKKTPEYFAQKKLTDLVINLKQTALPLAITLIAQFGITKVAQLIDQGKTKPSDLKDKISCPTPEELKKLISRKNKLVKQINNSLKIIDNATKALGIAEGIIILLDITLFTADNTPSSLNPFTPGLNKILSKTIDKLKSLNAGVLTILILVKQVLTQLLQYLSLLDTLVQHCSPNASQEQISSELTALTQQQSQNSPIVTNVNGFEMGVETEITTNSLKRRRAIARNKNGVVMLKGEWSFSSIDQILIDELVFYIQQNDLKAD